MDSRCSFRHDKPWLDKQFHDAEHTSIRKPDDLIADIFDPPGDQFTEDLLDRIRGSIFGLILGDALGAHVEFRPHEYLVANPVTDLQGGGTWGLAKGQFTDDSSMALCLLISLVARHGFIPYDQLVRYKWWYRHGYMSSTGNCFDIGSATTQSLAEFERRQKILANETNIPFEQLDYLSDEKLLQEFNVNCSTDGVAGNGALMRLAPVPMFFHYDPKLAIKYSGISARITHGDQKAYDACRYFGALMVATIHGEKKHELFSDQFYENHKDWFSNEPLHPEVLSIVQGSFKRPRGYEDGIRGKGYIINAIEAALWAFWSDEESFEKGVLAAVNLGDDTDTTAAIYGSLAGVYYGYRNLPKNWLDCVYAKDYIECLCKWMAYESSTTRPDRNPVPIKLPYEEVHSDTESESTATPRETPVIISMPTKLPTIDRTANHPSGTLGSLYDAYRDQLIPRSDCIIKDQQISIIATTMKCFVRDGHPRDHLNLLQMIDVTNELRLSLQLQIASPIGIAELMNYGSSIDTYTRFLYYNYLDREESMTGNADDMRRLIPIPTSVSQATHVVTGITLGIEVLAVLHIPSSDVSDIDKLLDRVQLCLTNGDNQLNMTYAEKRLLDRIIRTTVYSNVQELNQLNRLIELFDKINELRMNRTRHAPLIYKLSPIRFLYPEYLENNSTFVSLEPRIIDQLEHYFMSVSFQFKTLKELLGRKAFRSSDEHVRQQFLDAQRQFADLEAIYKNELKTLQDWVINARQGKLSPNATIPELADVHQNLLKESINKIINHLQTLKVQPGTTIERPTTFNSHNEHPSSSTQTSKDPLDSSIHNLRIRDTSYTSNSDLQYPIRPRIEHESLLDDDFKVLYTPNSKVSWPSRTHSEISRDTQNDNIINILLIGEVGVGKSTFINAFVNYYSFETLDSAELYEPVVIIPSSFVVTSNHWSTQSMPIEVGYPDLNEVPCSYGCSTTQQCRSYLVHMPSGTYIRFIDTPGLGATTDIKQHDLQMQSILSFVNNLTHLDAICFLLKPSFSRFAIYQFCFQRLFDFLGERISNNIIFCFTNACSTDFNSQEGIHLFETKLGSIVKHGIRMGKSNTFNFDSESFRYLVALQRTIQFDTASIYRIKSSWSQSKRESIRLIQYIRQYLTPIQLHPTCLSIEHAQLEIQSLVRPILETMRNMLRNYVLSVDDSLELSVELCPKPIARDGALCMSCTHYSCPVGKLWVRAEQVHTLDANRCYSCVCGLKQHLKVDYRLDHKVSSNRYQNEFKEMSDILQLIKDAAFIEQFLQKNNGHSRHDPFLCGINRMINEEIYIFSHYCPSDLNKHLFSTLEDLSRHYDQEMKQLMRESIVYFDLHRLNDKIKSLCAFPMIYDQMNAVIQSRDLFMSKHERTIPIKQER